jgi:23S rRNA (uracil1939-C5)-methyltransferase
MSEKIHKDDMLECTVDALAFGGRGVARADGLVYFIDGALPGQRVKAKVTSVKKRFAEAEVVSLVESGPDDVAPFCPHYGKCGGCDVQDLSYPAQLEWKRRFVVDSLSRIGGAEAPQVAQTVPSPQEQYYRNKMEFAFVGGGSERNLSLGLHKRGSTDSIVNVEHCALQSPFAMDVVAAARDFCRESAVPAYNPVTRKGLWRFLVVREARGTGQCMVHCITAPGAGGGVVRALGAMLMERFPQLTTFVHSTRKATSAIAFGEEQAAVLGPGYIEETVLGLTYRISPDSFFQTNTAAAEVLYATARDFAGLTGGETVWDLYCGSGGISLVMAQQAGRVVGFENVASAVEDASANAERNGVQNCEFVAGDVRGRISRRKERPDVVVTDPPRKGMHKDVVQGILDAAPQRIVYVSCNPTTLARDIGILSERYALRQVCPVDLFPHSAHVECVALLELK